ncbi:glycosyltransferase [Parageobacillus thermoglucosidasius]|uniref:glycosyltransferase n=1 Tax=Parageobacillus thermoglucosidasius TaxID=1426 RepID=UPI0001D16BB6|nr:glycosyltransferase [Parageobacillus thermoglucosidasius]AEH46347.1 glycosyl transferase family 2 [Parageobacillus thermoglucosidasius C56-YS93]
MKILIITEKFMYGGLETQIIGQVKYLKSHGHKIFLATGEIHKQFAENLLIDGLITGLPIDSNATADDLYFVVEKLSEFIAENEIDLIHAHPFTSFIPATFLATKCEIPLVITIHGPSSYKSMYGEFYDQLLRTLTFPISNLIFCVSDEVKTVAQSYTDENKLKILNNAVDTFLFKTAEMTNNGIWAVVSRIDSQKVIGIKDFIYKADKTNIQSIHVFGDGDSLEDLKDFVKNNIHSTNVEFKGLSTQIYKDLSKGYNGIAGMGRVVLEGLSMNLPVILIGYDGVKGLVDEKMLLKSKYWNYSGRGLKSINDIDLQECLLDLKSNPEKYRMRKWIEKYASERHVWSNYISLVSNINFEKYSILEHVYNLFKSHLGKNIPYLYDEELMLDYIDLLHRNNIQLSSRYLLSAFKKESQKVEHMHNLLKDNEIEILKQEINDLNQKIKDREDELAEKEKIIDELSQQNENLRKIIDITQDIVNRATNQSINLSNTKLFRLIHFIYRIKHQLIKGDMITKRKFFEWFFKRWNKRIYINDHTYNPIYQIVNILDEWKALKTISDPKDAKIVENLNNFCDRAETKLGNSNKITLNSFECENLKFNFKNKYDKYDIILLSIINYDFRHQRPQHLANIFAKKGHRVFYVNANFSNKTEEVSNKKDNNLQIYNIKSIYNNIYAIDSKNSSKEISYELEKIVNENGIRDCLIIVEYPTWIETAKFLKKKYGFKIVTDYLDDYTGFKETSSNYLIESSIEMLKISDRVIASSDYLAEKAKKFNEKVDIVRNGTEFEHFNKAIKMKSSKNKRKTIGYYGAIAHWFDFEKIEYLAENLVDVDIVLIGAITAGYDRLSKYSNVKLLGEKPYNELPKYLANFDVCLIPFDTTTDLIKATNPVKFYEYLSAGKKVVATEIPELIPFKDKYVYLTNDNDKFLEYVKMCLENSDNLASDDECVEFAKDNDWSNRGEAFLDFSGKAFPKVSVIVITYNQLEYTKKCISSIINKTAYPNYELIIVDNNSSDNTREYLKQIEKQHNNIKVILNEENYGFAGGNNIGLKYATGDYFILLNNDTVVTRGWITGLLKHFENNHKLGLVGPVTNSIGNEAMIKTDYNTLEDMDIFAYNYTTKHMGEVYKDIRTLAMFCVAISKSTFETVGFLDENYKVGMFEDDDYSFATLKAGYEIACAEDVFIHHFGSISFKKLENKEYKKIFDNNKKYYEKKWNTKWIPHKHRDGIM